MEDWEQRYREEDVPWDLGEAAPPFREVVENWPIVDWWNEGTVLVPGCGRGYDAALLHRTGQKVIGLDLSATALQQARELHGEGPGLRWVEGNLFSPDVRNGLTVDAVWEHTCFCAINPEQRPDYVDAMAELLAPGARLIGLFFLNPDVKAGPPFGARREDIIRLLAPSFTLGRNEVPASSTPARAGREWLAEFIRKD